MWIALNDGFLSIVEPRPFDVPQAERKLRGWKSNLLMVRARKPVHLKRHFPGHTVYRWKGRDYPCRVFVTRSEVAEIMGKLIAGVSYTNFKNSVHDGELHDAYMGVWSVMHRYQFGSFRRRQPEDWGKQRDFAWGRGETVVARAATDLRFGDAVTIVSGEETCGLLGCTPDQPCMDCLTKALAHENDRALGAEPDRYGDFDEEADAGSEGHLRVPPK